MRRIIYIFLPTLLRKRAGAHGLNNGPTLANHCSNDGTPLAKYWLNYGPTLAKHGSNDGTTLSKYWLNNGPTLANYCLSDGPIMQTAHWAIVGPITTITLAQHYITSMAQPWCMHWPNVGPSYWCYRGVY